MRSVTGETPGSLALISVAFSPERQGKAIGTWSGGLAERVGVRLPLTAGAVLAAVGFLLYSRIGIDGLYWTTFFPAACVLGCGAALFVAPLTTAIMSSFDASFASITSGVNNAVARIAGLLAIALLGLFLSINFYHTFDHQVASRSFISLWS